MSRSTIRRETLYYGSDREHQYWENEAQTLCISRNVRSLVWQVHGKKKGVYVPLVIQGKTARRRTPPTFVTGHSVEEIVSVLRRSHHMRLALEQRLRRWIHKSSGKRVLAFLDPNLSGAPVMTAPPQLYIQEQKKVSYM